MLSGQEQDPEALKSRLAELFYTDAYRRGKFILSSGRESSYYLDGKQIILSAEGLSLAARCLLGNLTASGLDADAVGGLSFGAAPIAAAVSAFSWHGHRSPLASFIVRKEPKQHGTQSRIEGPFREGLKTIIVDDILTTGSSLLSAAAAVREAGGRVLAAYVLVDRQEGGREAVEVQGYPLAALLTRADLELLDQRLKSKYPRLLAALESPRLNREELLEACGELRMHHPEISALAGQIIGSLPAFPSVADSFPMKAVAAVLRAVKTAGLSPGPQAARALLERFLQSG